MNTKIKYGLIGLLLLGIGFGVGKFAAPAKVITKTEFKEKIKVVEVIKEQKNVVVTTKKTTKKDGTIIEESKTEDKTVTFQDTKKESKTETSASTITTRDIGLSVHAMVMQDLDNIERKREYGIFVKKRVIGNISVGGLVTDQKTVGLSVGMDF